MSQNKWDESRPNNLEKLSRELKITRIFCLITSLMTAFLMAGGLFLYIQTRELISTTLLPVAEQASHVDIEALNTAVRQINSSLEQVDWEQVSDTLGKLNVDALNIAIENLDTRELSRTLTNLNAAVDTLQKAKEALDSLLSRLGLK